MKTILVVEDDAKQRRLYAAALASEVFTVWSALDGWEAIMLLQEQEFDLAIVEVGLQGTHGLHALLWRLAEKRGLPVILHPGYQAFKGDFLTWRAGVYVVKSSDLDEIKPAIALALAGRDGQGQAVHESAPGPNQRFAGRR